MPCFQREQVNKGIILIAASKQKGLDNSCQTIRQSSYWHADKLELVREFRVEFLVGEDSLERVIRSLKENHPYEEPAYDIIKLYQIEV